MAKQGFISWSGEESRKIAEQLKKFFNHTLAAPTMFVASQDLKAGEVWFTEIAQRLDVCDVGVIVVTPQNINRPWLHFEAGAIAKRVGRSAAIPLLCGVSTGDLSGTPLAQLQAITTAEKDIRDLCSRLNELLELGLPEDLIGESFPVWWERLHSGIDDPALWKASKAHTTTISIADISVQLNQVAAAVADLSDKIERPRPQAILGKLLPDEARIGQTLKVIDQANLENVYYPVGMSPQDIAQTHLKWGLLSDIQRSHDVPRPPKSLASAPSARPAIKPKPKA